MNNMNSMMFDDHDQRCFFRVHFCESQNFAIVTCLNLGLSDCRLQQLFPKRYWGKFSWDDKESSIKKIMHSRAKWNDLREAV